MRKGPRSLGSAFSDSVILEKHREHKDMGGKPSWWLGTGRTLMLFLVFGIAMFVLIMRLFSLTVIDGHRYRLLAESNRVRELVRHAPRGDLYDRTGKKLTENVPQYRLIRPCEKTIGKDLPGSCVLFIGKEKGDSLSPDALEPGEFLEVDYRRRYIDGESIAHVVGYTAEITGEELLDEYFTLRKYLRGDRVGRIGAEAVFEERLRGRDGKELVEVDATGTIMRTIGRDQEVPGTDITLALDTGMAKAVREAFPEGKTGAVIVAKPDTGEILAMYSSPTFNPDMFSGVSDGDGIGDVLTSQDRPLFNRAIGGVYPPGSTYKIVSALAALETGAIGPNTLIEDTGILRVGTFSFANWYFTQYGRTDGMVNVVRALERSNDIFFYKLGERTGIEALAEWSRKLGLGSPTGIELPGEASGLVPDEAWKAKRFSTEEDREARNNLWYDGDTYHMAIGQGYLLATPIQMNQWTNLVANGGKLCKPTIEKVGGTHKAVCDDAGIDPDNLKLIELGMVRACEPGGTGWPFFGFSVPKPGFAPDPESSASAVPKVAIPVACKTGTAEIGDALDTTHAWFTAFAPVPAEYAQESGGEVISGMPEISVTVLIEGGGEGSTDAAPVAKKILEAWFTR